jgi:hypothetical protein
LPNTTYDLPAFDLPKSSAGKSYVIFGKTDTSAIDLSKPGDKSKYTIDYLGDKNDNILTGTTKDEIFVAGAGNDILPEPVISITSMSWMRLSLILVRSRVKPAPLSLRV